MTPEEAKRRVGALLALRLGGFVLAGLGFALWLTDSIAPRQPDLGRGVIVLGLAFMLVLPALLLRRWRRGG